VIAFDVIFPDKKTGPHLSRVPQGSRPPPNRKHFRSRGSGHHLADYQGKSAAKALPGEGQWNTDVAEGGAAEGA